MQHNNVCAGYMCLLREALVLIIGYVIASLAVYSKTCMDRGGGGGEGDQL